ncbi:MAG: polysaccharide deacetylase family protein, partial [Pyrinomonadaceae bacterium]
MTNASLLLKRSIKSAASIAKTGIGYPRTAPGTVNIIAYHRVVADIAKAERDAIYGIVVSTDTFRHHCEMLRDAFDVVSLETAMHFMDDRRTVARPMAVLTFDDGYLDFYEQAFPVLNELGLPATVFLPTDYIGGDKPLAHDRIYWLLKIALENSIDLTDALG